MPKGPNGEYRPADSIGLAVMVGKIATGEASDATLSATNRRKSGVAGAKARMKNTSVAQRSHIATLAASARWKKEEATMNADQNACDAVAALYKRKEAAGLVDVKFFLDDIYKATRETVCGEVLRLEAAIDNGDFEELVFNDRY